MRRDNPNQAYLVSAFTSVPTLTVLPPKATTAPAGSYAAAASSATYPPATYRFVDALETFRYRLTPHDLDWAYRRVGRGYRGLLTSYFLVLNEDGREKALGRFQGGGDSGPNSQPVGVRGRGRGRGQKRPSDECTPDISKRAQVSSQ
jgi:hypothetical protein